MGEILTEVLDLLPSLLIFSSVGFAILFGLPRLRVLLKSEFDKRLKSGQITIGEFFHFDFYITVTTYLDFVAIGYILGTVLIMLSPLHRYFGYSAYAAIFFLTVGVLILFAGCFYKTLRIASKARIVFD